MLTQEQDLAVTTDERRAVVCAGAGSGKTLLIVERCKELVGRGVTPESIVVLTFSRAAAEEIRERLGIYGRRMHVGTFHSVILSVMAKLGERPNVLDEGEAAALIDECAVATGAAISKATGIKYQKGKGNPTSWRKEMEARKPSQFLDVYLSKLAMRGDIDYVGIIRRGISLAQSGGFNCQYVIVDEAQDNDPLQWQFVKLLAESADTLIVGDVNQCQPAGTMVRVVSDHYYSRHKQPSGQKDCQHQDVPIEQVKVGDMVVTYSVAQRHFYRTGKVVERVASRPYKGELVVIETREKASRYTPDHLCVVKMKDAFFGKHFVYLMRKGNQFRIGKAIGVENGDRKSRFGFMARTTAEGADAIWLLSSHATDSEARMQESILSLTYGIPQLMWKNNSYKYGASQAYLDEFWDKYRVDNLRAAELLSCHGRSINHPLWTRGKHTIIARRLTLLHACNLMDGMNVLCADHGYTHQKERKWLPISVRREQYDGVVHSLQVADTETYMGDGIVTHNCIHAWRGASPEEFEGLGWHTYLLTETFRCPQAVVDVANKIRHITLTLRTNKLGGNVVTSGDTLSLIRHAANTFQPEDMAVLCRYNDQADKWADELEALGLPILRRKPTERGPIFWLLRYLSNPSSYTARVKCAKVLQPYLSLTNDGVVQSICSSRQTSHVQQLTEAFLMGVGVSYGPAEILRSMNIPAALMPEALGYSKKYTGETLDFWRQEELSDAPLPSVANSGITVGTIHGSKGLEWQCVFMPELSGRCTVEECRLFYVGTTRSMDTLVFPDGSNFQAYLNETN